MPTGERPELTLQAPCIHSQGFLALAERSSQTSFSVDHPRSHEQATCHGDAVDPIIRAAAAFRPIDWVMLILEALAGFDERRLLRGVSLGLTF